MSVIGAIMPIGSMMSFIGNKFLCVCLLQITEANDMSTHHEIKSVGGKDSQDLFTSETRVSCNEFIISSR